jgi:hypothetical protein
MSSKRKSPPTKAVQPMEGGCATEAGEPIKAEPDEIDHPEVDVDDRDRDSSSPTHPQDLEHPAYKKAKVNYDQVNELEMQIFKLLSDSLTIQQNHFKI